MPPVDSDRGGSVFHFLWATALVIVLLFLTVCVLAGNGKDDHRGVPGVVTYRLIGYQGGDDYGNDDGGRYGNDNDNRRCRGNNCRGSFSPGPFDRSPVDVHDNCVSLDCSGSGGKKPPAQGQQPKQLFPPSPQALRDFVVATVKGGIEMGRLFADTTITFVSNLMVGLA